MLFPHSEVKVLFLSQIAKTNQIMKTDEVSQAELEADLKRRHQRAQRAKRKKVARFIDRVFGFFLATLIVGAMAGLALEYIIVKGPSPALKERFVMTMLETRRFGFISKVFLTQDEVDEINSHRAERLDFEFDASLIQIADQNQPVQGQTGETDPKPEENPYGYVDEDGDGYILVDVSGRGYNGKMLIVLDPKRVFLGKGGEGHTLNMIAHNNGAIGGINAGSFFDPDGTGSGREPDGLTIIQGNLDNIGSGARETFVGFDADGIMHVGYYNFGDAMDNGITNGVTFGPGPLLIVNGIPQDTSALNCLPPARPTVTA